MKCIKVLKITIVHTSPLHFGAEHDDDEDDDACESPRHKLFTRIGCV